METIGFIGTGQMAKAIINGMLNKKFESKIIGYDRNENNYEFLKELGVELKNNAIDVVRNCKFLILAVKPQNFSELIEEIKLEISEKNVVISIAAGISQEFLFKKINPKLKFVRVMPNTPFILGAGAVAISKGSNVEDSEFNFVKNLFSTGGLVQTIPEEQMNSIVAINGSSPAYIYLFAKGFLNFAQKEGIEKDVSLKLFASTLIGSAQMILKSGKEVDELIKDVSSPNGTTVEGLNFLEKNNFLKIIEETCAATAKRADELSKSSN